MNDNDGVEKVDLEKVDWRGSREFFESLGDALDKLDDHDESYDFTWVGKRKSIIEAGAPINKTLRPDVENSKNWDTTENLFIEGDNLDALKLLQESYLGKVKMIYIDPPYNTGKDFVYHDNFRADTEQYDEDTEYKDDEGNIQFKKNEKSNGRYHSDWLSMMQERLTVARDLLIDDGVIFISIGDDEHANLKRICDDIFGEENFIADFIWEKTQHFGRQKINSYSNGDYILCYARQLFMSEGVKKELLVEFEKDEFEDAPLFNASNPVNIITFPANSTQFNLPDGTYNSSTDAKYELVNEVSVVNGRNANDFQLKFSSRWSASKVVDEFKKGTTYWVKSDKFSIRAIYAEGKLSNESPKQIIFSNSKNEFVARSRQGIKVGTNEDGSSEITTLFEKTVFSYPKPTSLIQYLLSLSDGDIYMDFFAGSGTTAHATMLLNALDGGSRQHITVQLPEDLDESLKIAVDKNEREVLENAIELCDQTGRPHVLTEVTKERIRRAAKKIREDYAEQIAKRDTPLDTGFRAYKLSSSNFIDTSRHPNETTQTTLLDTTSNIKQDRSAEDLLTETILDLGLTLDLPIQQRDIASHNVYFVGGNSLVACFDDTVSLDIVGDIAAEKPLRVVFKDSSFADDQARINIDIKLKQLSPDTIIQVV